MTLVRLTPQILSLRGGSKRGIWPTEYATLQSQWLIREGMWIFIKIWYVDNIDTRREKGCSFSPPLGSWARGESPLREKPVPEPGGTGDRDRIFWHYLSSWVQPCLKPKSTFRLYMCRSQLGSWCAAWLSLTCRWESTDWYSRESNRTRGRRWMCRR